MSTAQIIPFPRTDPAWVPPSASADLGALLLYLRDELPERYPHLRNLALDVYVRKGKNAFGVTALGGFRGRRLEVECSDPIEGLLHLARRLAEIPAARTGFADPLLSLSPEHVPTRDAPSSARRLRRRRTKCSVPPLPSTPNPPEGRAP